MMVATTRSGHPVPVPNTPAAASSTARLPTTSFARANPGRPHIGIAFPEGPKQCERRGVGDQRRDANRAHREGARQCPVQRVPDDRGDHPQPEGAHGRALRQRRTRAITQRHADNQEADGVVRAVPEKIQRVGLQRRGARRQACRDLDQEHDGVDRQHRPEHAAIGAVAPVGVWVQRRRGAAAVGHAPQAMQRGRTSQPRGHRGAGAANAER